MASWRDAGVPAAAALEGLAVLAVLGGDGVGALAAHAASCGALALALHRRLLEGAVGIAVTAAIALFVPVLGAAGLVAIALVSPAGVAPTPFDVVRTPVPGVAQASAAGNAAHLAAASSSPRARVLAARGRSDPEAIALLRRALEDPDEDVRLVAFAMLESRSRTAYRGIHEATRELERAAPRDRPSLHPRLAAAHFELARLGLAQGECLEHALEHARRHARAALDHDGGRASLHLLLGRVALRRGEARDAEAALLRATALGLPGPVAMPYLAEAAFLERRFDVLRDRLAAIAPAGNPALERVRRYWC